MPNGSFGFTVGASPVLETVFGPAGFGLLAAEIVTLPLGAVLEVTLAGLLEGLDTAEGGFVATPLPADLVKGPPVVGGFRALAVVGFEVDAGLCEGAGNALGAALVEGSAFFAPCVEGKAFCAAAGFGAEGFTAVLPDTGPSAAMEP